MKERLKKFNKISNYKVVAFCLFLFVGIMYYYEEIRAADIEKIPTMEVIVLKNDIAEDIVITEDMVSKELRYVDKFIKDANIVKTFDEIVGKRTKVPLHKDETISNDRLLVNDASMDEQGMKISLQVDEVDRALALKKGDFIDVWAVPIVSKVDPNYISTYKLFKKLRIIEIFNTNKQIIDPNKEYENIEDKVPLYVTVQLNDEEMKALHNIDKAFLSIKFTKHKENELYTIVDEKTQEQEQNTEVGDEDGQGNN